MRKPSDMSTEVAKVATVMLIQATRLPAHHVKLLIASVDNPEIFGSLCLFEPNLPELHRKGVTMSDDLVDAQGAATLLMNNQEVEPFLLEVDNVIGHLKRTRLVLMLGISPLAIV